MVGLGAGGVDFAPHLLGDESEFLAVGALFGHGLTEIVDVLLEADFLFGDVELLEVVDEFLLEAVGVGLLDGGLGKVFADAFFGRLDALGLVGRNLVEFLFDEVDMLRDVAAQDFALFLAEAVDLCDGLFDGLPHECPFLFVEVALLRVAP